MFIYNSHTDGDIFNHMGILQYKYKRLPKYGQIPQYLFEFSKSPREWNASFKSKTDNTSHLKLPNTENVSFNKG